MYAFSVETVYAMFIKVRGGREGRREEGMGSGRVTKTVFQDDEKQHFSL
jgi:hypothetical protein